MSQRDRAAVDVDLVIHIGVRIGAVHLRPAQDHRGEGLVDLDQVDVIHRHSGLLQHPCGGLHRTIEVVVRLGPDEGLGHDARPREQALRPCHGLVHPQHRGRAVGDLR